jgi:hypothetical protein
MARNRSQLDSFPGPIGEARAISTAAGGTALSNAATLIPIPNGTTHLQILPRNFSTAVVAKVALNPYLAVLVNNDALATVPTDNSSAAQDGDAATLVTISALKSLANGGAIYVGSHVPFRALRSVTVGANTGSASTILVEYWNGSTWVDISATDGSTTGGKTFAQSGDITWTIPAAWAKKELYEIFRTLYTPCVGPFVYSSIPLYWLRISVSVVLSATVTLSSLMALNRSTAYAELLSSLGLEFRISKQLGGQASVEALTDAGTANLVVNAFTELGGGF